MILTNSDIYITGHGNKKKQTISDYTMKDIANMLVNNKNSYTGKQDIVIVSCHGKSKNSQNQDMSDLLKEELLKLNVVANVRAIGEYTTVFLDKGKRAGIYDVKFDEFGFTQVQNRMLRDLVGKEVNINGIGKYYAEHSKELAKYNQSLLNKGADKKMEEEMVRYTLCLVSLLVIMFIGGIASYITGNPIPLIIAVVICIVLVILIFKHYGIFEFFKRE